MQADLRLSARGSSGSARRNDRTFGAASERAPAEGGHGARGQKRALPGGGAATLGPL